MVVKVETSGDRFFIQQFLSFQLGIAVENEMNAYRLKPCWSYTMSGGRR